MIDSEAISSNDNNAVDDSIDVTGSEQDTETEINNPTVADPVIQNMVLVNFEITVPAYQSNELRVELVWGDINLTAMWVGDELWSATGEFPTQTEQPLIVSFYDLNGDLDLARFSQEFRTGSNATEAFQILADQFNAEQFDTDQDGVNNLDESIAGTSPIVDEDSLLSINDTYEISYYPRMSVSRSFESLLSEERPYFHSSETIPVEAAQVFEDVDIDAEGNGTLSFDRYRGSERLNLEGTRTHSENSVTWEGSRYGYAGDYHHNGTFTNTVSVVDDNTRTLVEELEGSNVGTYTFRWEISTNLTGQLIDETSLCKPVAGNVSITYTRNPGAFVSVTTISKKISDSYWRVVNVHNDIQYDTIETREYFAQELIIYRGDSSFSVTGDIQAPEDPYFICDFVDF